MEISIFENRIKIRKVTILNANACICKYISIFGYNEHVPISNRKTYATNSHSNEASSDIQYPLAGRWEPQKLLFTSYFVYANFRKHFFCVVLLLLLRNFSWLRTFIFKSSICFACSSDSKNGTTNVDKYKHRVLQHRKT